MTSIVLTNSYSDEVLEIVSAEAPEGFELIPAGLASDDEFSKMVSQADYMLVGGRRKITRDLLAGATRLKMIQRSGVGLDMIDLDAVRDLGIPLRVNQGINSQSVAEHTLMLMLACLKNLPQVNNDVHRGLWIRQPQGLKNHELAGSVVGIVGMGNIGKTLTTMLLAMGAKVEYFSVPRLEAEEEQALSLQFKKLDDLFASADILSLHCPLTDETVQMVNAERIARMRPDAILVNTARGGLIDEEALYEALESRHIACAALDVFAEEPPGKGNRLLELDNVIATSHIAGITNESFRKMMREAFRSIEEFHNANGSKKMPRNTCCPK